MNILKKTGAIEILARLISPVLKLLFPTAYKTGNGIYECAASISANLLGIGNAATPFALSALKEMQKDNENSGSASDDMIMLTLISASPISIMPMTVIALRNGAGSVSPTKILVPVWICSICGFIITVILARALAKLCRGKRKSK
jgi:spore maturation protein A